MFRRMDIVESSINKRESSCKFAKLLTGATSTASPGCQISQKVREINADTR